MRTNHIRQQIFPLRCKNAPIPTERPRFGPRELKCLDLGAVAAPNPKKTTTKPASVVASKTMDMPITNQKEVTKK